VHLRFSASENPDTIAESCELTLSEETHTGAATQMLFLSFFFSLSLLIIFYLLLPFYQLEKVWY